MTIRERAKQAIRDILWWYEIPSNPKPHLVDIVERAIEQAVEEAVAAERQRAASVFAALKQTVVTEKQRTVAALQESTPNRDDSVDDSDKLPGR